MLNRDFLPAGYAILDTPHTSTPHQFLNEEIGDAGFLSFLNFRKPAPRSQGCEVRAFLNSLDTVECGKFLAHFFYHKKVRELDIWGLKH